MKKLLTILFIICSVASFGQGGWVRQNTTYGIRDYRRAFDSTLLFPAWWGGAPVDGNKAALRAYDLRLPGLLGDTANKVAYIYWPKDSSYQPIGTGVGGLVSEVTTDWSVLDSIVDPSSYTGTITAGDIFLVAEGATGAFAGEDNHIAVFDDPGWDFDTAQIGDLLFNVNNEEYSLNSYVYKLTSDGWVIQGSSYALLGGNRQLVIIGSKTASTSIISSNVKRLIFDQNGVARFTKMVSSDTSIGGFTANGTLIRFRLDSLLATVGGTSLNGTGYVKMSGTTPSYLTPTQTTADLDEFTTSLQGVVPGSGGGSSNFLRADGTWAAPVAGSVNVYAPLVKSGDTIHQRYNVLHYGAVGDGTTDDTQPIQAAMDAALSAGGGVVYFPYTGNDYIIGGPLVTNGSGDSSQIVVPHNATTTTLGTIKLMGEFPPNQYTDYRVSTIPGKMVILRSTSTKAAAVLGSATGNFTQFEMENICIRVRSKTGGGSDTSAIMTAFDARKLQMLRLTNYRFDTQSGQSTGLQPAATAIGLRLPTVGNYALVNATGGWIQNFYTGIEASEHANLDNNFIATCYRGIYSSATPHPMYMGRNTIAWCKQNIVLATGTLLFASQLDFEDYNPDGITNFTKWFDHQYDFYEPSGSSSQANTFYTKIVANGIGSTALDNSYSSPTVFNYPIGTALGIAHVVTGNYDRFSVATSASPYPRLIVNTTSATQLGGIDFQRSGVDKFGLVGDPNVTTNEFGMYDYINSRVPWYYSATSKDLFLNTGINAQFNGNLYLSTANAKVGIGVSPTYQLDISGAAVSNINARISSTGGIGRLLINSTSNSGVSFSEATTINYSFFSTGAVFGIYNDVNSRYSMRVSTTNKMATGDVAPTSAWLTIPAGTTSAEAIRLTTGPKLTTPVAGALEYTTPQLFFTNGGAVRQELIQSQQSRVTSNFNATTTTTLADINTFNVAVNVAAGKTYRFEVKLYTTSDVAGGVKAAIAGTATATAIIYEGETHHAASITAQTRATALGTTVGATTPVTDATVYINGTITVNAAGTLTVQFAQNASNGSASTVLIGSTFVVSEIL